MSLPTTDSHDDVADVQTLDDVAAHLRNDGYSVVLSPRLDDVPAFARGVRPDAIARRDGGGGVIVVVRTRDELVHDATVTVTADAVRLERGWRFDVLVRPTGA